MTLLGLLFPSWTFFDAVRLVPTLQVRLVRIEEPAGAWRAAILAPRRRWWHVLFNPAGTQTLSAQTLVETWCRELTERADTAPGLDGSRPLVFALAECAVLEMEGPVLRDGDGWQLRLIVTDDDDHLTVLYESERVPWPVIRVAT